MNDEHTTAELSEETIRSIEDLMLKCMVQLCVRLGQRQGEATIESALTAIRAAHEIGSPILNQPVPEWTDEPMEDLLCHVGVHSAGALLH